MNAQRIMRVIWSKKGISRIEIAKMLGLDKSTVTTIVSKLIKIGLVETLAEGEAGQLGGRKPICLGIKKSFGVIIGAEITSQYCDIVCINLDGEIVFSKNFHIEITSANLVKVFCDIIRKVKKAIKKLKLPVLGIGIGTPGIVDPYQGTILRSRPLNLTDPFELKKELNKKFDIPIFIDNDANCCCWGELAFHKSSELMDFIFILGEFHKRVENQSEYIGAGIGLGLVINGKVYHGVDFTAGEFQSVFWQPENMSQFSISNKEMRKSEKNKEVFLRFVRELSINISLIVSIFNLKQIYLGGFFHDKHQAETMQIITAAVEKNLSYINRTECEIKFSSLGNNSVAYGAAGMYLERFFAIPEIAVGTKQAAGLDSDVFSILNKYKNNF